MSANALKEISVFAQKESVPVQKKNVFAKRRNANVQKHNSALAQKANAHARKANVHVLIIAHAAQMIKVITQQKNSAGVPTECMC